LPAFLAADKTDYKADLPIRVFRGRDILTLASPPKPKKMKAFRSERELQLYFRQIAENHANAAPKPNEP
jgi:hypothetical protein